MRLASAPTLVFCLIALVCAGCAGNDQDPAAAITRMQAIGESKLKTGENLTFLEDRLANGGDDERAHAAWALGEVGEQRHLEGLTTMARFDSSKYARINAIEAAGKLGTRGTGQTLVGFLGEPDDEVRAAVLRAIGDPRFEGYWRPVAEAMLHGTVEMRAMAAQTLSSMNARDSLPLLERAAGDPEGSVRSAVAFTCGKLRDERAVPRLTLMLQDPEWDVRANAAQALGMIGAASAKDPLSKLLDDPVESVRVAADSALQKLGGS